MLKPYPPVRINRYCRLFPPGPEAPNREILRELGRSTAANSTSIPRPLRPTPPPAAYTYFGQFIDHDLSFDATELEEAGGEPTDTANASGGVLDLNQLYGDGPGSQAHDHLYEADHASFRLGAPTFENGEPFDIPLTSAGQAAPHPQNSENLILRQLHAMFLKLHNSAVAECTDAGSAEARFLRARERVRWQYQYLVRQDFLARVTRNEVYSAVTAGSDGWTIDWASHGFAIPVEFAQAAFRFGHSMVRHEYRLNQHTPAVSLQTIFSRTVMVNPLTPDQAIDWDMFTNGIRENSMAIDTRIVTPLHELPSENVHHHVHLHKHASDLPPELPVRTLWRGGATRLPVGETVAEAFKRGPLEPLPYEPGKVNPWEKLDELKLTGQTPLWFWILLEAETESRGARLGTVGSRLVAEVIEGSLWADPESYLRRFGRNWQPEPWRCRDGHTHTITTLKDLAIVTGLWPHRH